MDRTWKRISIKQIQGSGIMRNEDMLLTLLCRELIDDLGVGFEYDIDKFNFIDSILDENSKNEMYEAILDILDKRYKELKIEVE